MNPRRSGADFWTDVLFGALAGGVGTYVIGQAMAWLPKLEREEARAREQALAPKVPPPVKVGRTVLDKVGVHPPEPANERIGKAVHWSYGVMWGALYGALYPKLPRSLRAAGIPFGLLIGVLGGDVMLPLLHLTAPPQKLPIDAHLSNLAAHAAYGAATNGTFFLLKKAMA